MNRGGQSFIQDADFMVLLQGRNNPSEHGHALCLDWLFDLYHLETTGESWIFFKILFVFRPSRGGDGAQFAACQGWLQKVRGIALPRLSACANHGVSFVDE